MNKNNEMDVDKVTEVSLTQSDNNKRSRDEDQDEDQDEDEHVNKKTKFYRKCKYCRNSYHNFRCQKNRDKYPVCYRKWIEHKSLFKNISELYHNLYIYLNDNDCLPEFITPLNNKLYLSDIRIKNGNNECKINDSIINYMNYTLEITKIVYEFKFMLKGDIL